MGACPNPNLLWLQVSALLSRLKQQCTLLVVSHDLRELASLVDCAWRMKLGGRMLPTIWPPPELSGLSGSSSGSGSSSADETS